MRKLLGLIILFTLAVPAANAGVLRGTASAGKALAVKSPVQNLHWLGHKLRVVGHDVAYPFRNPYGTADFMVELVGTGIGEALRPFYLAGVGVKRGVVAVGKAGAKVGY